MPRARSDRRICTRLEQGQISPTTLRDRLQSQAARRYYLRSPPSRSEHSIAPLFAMEPVLSHRTAASQRAAKPDLRLATMTR